MPMSRRARGAALCALVLALAAPTSSADVVVLKDGRRIEGTLVRDDDKVVVRTGLGELEFPRSAVKEIVRGKTPREEFAAREAAARTADDFAALGDWARERDLSSLAKKAWKRAVELDGDHAAARASLGFVKHGGEWLTLEQRDARVKQEDEAAQRAKGLVQHAGRWVTPEDKQRLEQGLVEVDGQWVTADEAKRLAGFELFAGAWMPRAEAVARGHAASASERAEVELQLATTAEALVAGPFEATYLTAVGQALLAGRAWFDRAYTVEPGLALYGGALAEFYVWQRDERPYVDTVDLFASWTPTASPAWAAAVKRVHGLYWFDPFPLSSARIAHRSEADLTGHCLHHLGHLAAGRLGYDGRLLPPWYDEAVAALCEFRVTQRNAVFCQARGETVREGGTVAQGKTVSRMDFDPAKIRSGQWLDVLLKGLEAEAVPPLQVIAAKEFNELELVDIAAGMGVLSWLESRAAPSGGSALAAFHAALRHKAPDLPLRVIEDSRQRAAAYDAAFQAAAGLFARDADQEWRRWLKSR
jgi:hypothetical protein